MPVKCDFIFQAVTRRLRSDDENAHNPVQSVGRVAGFSETWYTEGDLNGAATIAKLRSFSEARARLLPDNCAVIAQRVTLCDATGEPSGNSRTFEFEYPGRAGTQNALPSKALCWQMRGDAGTNHRVVILRSCPDARVQEGEYRRTPNYDASVRNFFAVVIENWKMRGRVRSNPRIDVVSITPLGVVTTAAPHGFVNTDKVTLLRCMTPAGVYATGIYNIAAAAGNTFTIINYVPPKSGETVTRGKVRKHGMNLFAVTIEDEEMMTPDAISKKVGAPFKRFVGRR